jgi:hypothetical protein
MNEEDGIIPFFIILVGRLPVVPRAAAAAPSAHGPNTASFSFIFLEKHC